MIGSPRSVSAATTMSTGAAATPPVAPASTSAKSPGERRSREKSRPRPSHARRVSSPIAARRAGVADHDELPRLLVLRARRVRGGVEHLGDQLVRHGGVGERAARTLAVHHGEEVGHTVDLAQAPERVHVHDAQRGVVRPVVERGRARLAEQRGDERRHRLERGLGIVGVHLVEVHEARIAAGHVLVRRDHGVAGDGDLGDVADVHEVAPVPQRLRLIGLARGDEHERETDRGLAREPTLSGPWVVAEVMAGHAVGHRGRGEVGVDLVDAEERELGKSAGKIGAIPHDVLPPCRPLHPGLSEHLGHPTAGVRVDGPVGHLEVQPGRDAVLHNWRSYG